MVFAACSLRPILVGLVSVAAVVGAWGCGAGSPGDGAQLLRLVTDSPQELLELSILGRSVDVAELPLQPVRWEAGPDGTVLVNQNGGLELVRADRAKRWAETRSEIDASEIDVVEIEFEGLRLENSVALTWWAEDRDQALGPASIDQRAGRPPRDGRQKFRFEVGRHRGWRGRIHRMRIEIGRRPAHTAIVRSIHLLRTEADPEAIAIAAARPWAVDLNGVVRSAMLGVPGADQSHIVEIANDSVLNFFWGVPSTIRVPVRLSVVATPLNGDREGRTETLWEKEVDPKDAALLGRWHREVIDLGGVAAGRMSIRYGTRAADAFNAARGLPAWGNPEVRRRSAAQTLPNIVVVCLDTLRADHLSLYGYHRQTSPYLDAWAGRRAVVFETAVAPASWTLPSHLSMFTGLAAPVHGINHPTPVPASFTLLAERLRTAGYATMAVTGGRYLDASYGLFQGFDAFVSPGGDPRDELDLEIEKAIEWIEAADATRPFFLFFHTYEIHDPYWPREPFYSEFAETSGGDRDRSVVARTVSSGPENGFRRQRVFLERNGNSGRDEPLSWEAMGDVRALYDSGIARADAGFGRLVDALEERGLDEDMFLAVVSDHGEALGEHRLAGHTSLYDHDLLVPMVIALPKSEMAGRRIGDQVRLIDLAPTVLELAGVEGDAGAQGRSLVGLIRGRGSGLPAISIASLTNFGVSLRTTDGVKVIVANTPWPAPTGAVELYDTGVDPGENEPLDPATSEATMLVERLMSEYGSTASGLLIEIDNRGESPAVVTFDSSTEMPFARNTVKALGLHTHCSPKGKRHFQCTVPPMEAITLLCEDLASRRFEIAYGVADGVTSVASTLEIDLAGGPGPWRGSGGGSMSSVEVWATWQGPVPMPAPSASTLSEELREQLEALGYVQ